MSKEDATKVTQDVTGKEAQPDLKEPSSTPADNPAGEDVKKENEKVVPYSEFQKLYARTKSAEEKLEEVTRAANEAEENKLKENEQYKELLEKKEREFSEVAKAKETLTGLQSEIDLLWDQYKEQIPEDKLSLIPESLPPIEKIKYVNQNRDFILGGDQSKQLGTKTPKGENPVLDEDTTKRNRYEEIREKIKSGDFVTMTEKQEFIKLGRELGKK